MLLIGFGHKARQGKNSAAVAVVNACPLDAHARIYAYADALRAEVKRAQAEYKTFEILHTCLGCPSWVIKETGKPRTLLQWWGTEYRRAQDPNYWVKRLRETLERDNPEVAVITDVRFTNEADAIHAMGGYVVKVTRTTKPDIDVPAHPSENEMDSYTGWDFKIEAATLADLHRQATAIFHQVAGDI